MVFSGIIIIFLVCHFPRIILNILELATIQRSQVCQEAGLPMFSLWSLIMISVSHLLLVFNSATNMIVYCLLSSKFRAECVKTMLGFRKRASERRARRGGGGGGRGGCVIVVHDA